jgi:hypothetical protein
VCVFLGGAMLIQLGRTSFLVFSSELSAWFS